MNLQRTLRVSERLALGLLALVHLAIRFDWPVANWGRLGAFARMLCEATDLSQLALVSSWAVLGPAPVRWRWLAAGLLLFAWFYFPANFGSESVWPPAPRIWDEFGPEFLSAFIGASAVILLGFRWAGVGVARVVGEIARGVRFQFSLRKMFLATVVAAVLVRGAQMLHAAAIEDFDLSLRFALAGLGAALAAVAVFSLWAVLSPGPPYGRLLALGAISPLLALTPPYLAGKNAWFVPLIFLSGMLAAVMAASLLVIRSCGFYLSVLPRTQSNQPNPPDSASAGNELAVGRVV